MLSPRFLTVYFVDGSKVCSRGTRPQFNYRTQVIISIQSRLVREMAEKCWAGRQLARCVWKVTSDGTSSSLSRLARSANMSAAGTQP